MPIPVSSPAGYGCSVSREGEALEGWQSQVYRVRFESGSGSHPRGFESLALRVHQHDNDKEVRQWE